MKTLLIVFVLCGLARAGVFAASSATPGTVVWPKDGGVNPANRYVVANDPATTGQAVLDLGAVGTGGGTATFNATRPTPGMLVVGENASASVVSSGFIPLAWFYCGPLAPGQVITPYGKFRNGQPVDWNGVPVDWLTGQPLPGEDPQMIIPLVNPFKDRGFTYDVQILDSMGNVVGDSIIELGPGETRNIGLSNGGGTPFSANVYPVIEGQLGNPTTYHSTGGGGSSGGGTSTTPTINGSGAGTGGTTTPTTNPPQQPTGSTEAETQNAINRLSTITANYGEANKQGNNSIIAGINALGNKANSQLTATTSGTALLGAGLAGVKGAVDAATAAIEAQGPNSPGGGSGLTQAQVRQAVNDGVTDAYTGVAGPHNADEAGLEGVLDGTASASQIATVSRISSKMGDTISHLQGMVSGLGLSGTYGAATWDFSAYMGSFLGSVTFSFADYAWFFSLVRVVELWLLSVFFMRQYFGIVRSALVG